MTEELVIHGTAAAAFVVVLVGVGHGHFFVDGRRGGGKVVGGLIQLLLFGVRNWMKHHYNIKGCRRGQVFWKTLDGGERGGKGGAMRACQKWFWHDSIFSCDRQ
jgi:hypothetical protein